MDDLADLIETLGLGSHLAHYPGELSLGLARPRGHRQGISRCARIFFCLMSRLSRWIEAVGGPVARGSAVLTEAGTG